VIQVLHESGSWLLWMLWLLWVLKRVVNLIFRN